MPNWLSSVGPGRGTWPGRRAAHGAVRSTADRQHRGRRRQRRADVEHHLDVGAELRLDVDRGLGREPVGAAVVGGPERDAVVVEGHVAARLEGEDLVAAGVGEHVAGPVGEAVQPPEALDDVGAGLQHQVVRVAEHDLHAEVGEVGGRQGAHRAPGAHRHEARRADLAAGRADDAGPRRAGRGGDLHRRGSSALAPAGTWRRRS